MLTGEDGADVLRGGEGDDQSAGADSGDLIAVARAPMRSRRARATTTVVATEGTDTVTTTAAGNDVVFTRPRAPGKLRCRRSKRGERVRLREHPRRGRRAAAPTAWPRSTASTAPTPARQRRR